MYFNSTYAKVVSTGIKRTSIMMKSYKKPAFNGYAVFLHYLVVYFEHIRFAHYEAISFAFATFVK